VTIEEFWNRAFLAALCRLPPEKAKCDADEATKLCIDHWHANCYNYSAVNFPLVQDVDIANARFPAKNGKVIPGSFGLKTSSDQKQEISRKRAPPKKKR
jgi:hypothetical protein